MSQRPPASRPASRSPPEGQRFTLPPVQLRDDLHRERGRPAERQQPEPESRGFVQQLQTSPQHAQSSQNTGPGEDWRGARQQRDLGVHSILNPSEPDDDGSSSRRMSVATNESPISAVGRPHYGASPSTAPSRAFPTQIFHHGTAPRRILTPRSPSARSVSVGRGAPATIDAHQTPFLPSRGRAYMAEPGPNASSEIPSIPNPGQQYQQQYGFPSASSTPTAAPRRSSGGAMQAPGSARLSHSASPSISASSNNLSSNQTSPASFLNHIGGTQPTPLFYSPQSFGTAIQAGDGIQFQGPSGVPAGPYTSPAPQTHASSTHSGSEGRSRQTSASDPISVLTFTTSQGSYAVPIDVHQASKLADEKRARNAGASARFRQRRKEKEKEANTSIEKLQQQSREQDRKMREIEQERDRYRHERDRLRDLVFRNPEMRHLAMSGPPSPQTMRSGSFPSMGQPPLQPSHQPPSQAGFHGPESSSERAPRRRRTDTQGEFTSLPYALPPASSLQPVQQSPSYFGPQGPGPPNLPPLRIEPAPGPQTTDANITPSTSAGHPPPHDPYSRGPYERGWLGDAGRR